jgi:hypothetical protein
MKLTHLDFKETTELAELVKKIDDLNVGYVNTLSDEIFQRQPFFLTVLLGYRLDVTTEELEEIMKIYFLVWEYFKVKKKVPTKKVTEADFEKVQSRHIEMLKYAEGESDQKEISNVYAHDLEKIVSKSLLTVVLFRYNTRPVLIKMDEQSKGVILVGIKSFIECFENSEIKSTTAQQSTINKVK